MNIINDLNQAGYKIKDLYDLMNNYKNYKSAIPLLIKCLENVKCSKNVANKELLVRCLSRRYAKGDYLAKLLVKEFYSENDFSYRWSIGNAMNFVMTKNQIDDVLKIIENESFGKSREMFVIALSKFKTNKVEDFLVELLVINDLTSHALEAIRRLKLTKALNHVEKYLEDERPLVRKEALKAYKKIT